MSDYQLWLGDCLEEMSRIDDGSVDMILADLPYGTTACKWDTVIPFEPLWTHYKRVIKRRGAVLLFGSQPFTSMLVMSNLGWFKQELIWEKQHPKGFLDARRKHLDSHETILLFGAGTTIYNPQGLQPVNIKSGRNNKMGNGVYGYVGNPDYMRTEGNFPRSVLHFDAITQNNLHPTQKPVALLEYLIRTYTNEGELVLDNTFGSCSTGEACLRTKRRFIGIEKDEQYYQIGVDRMERVAAELRGEFVPKKAKGKLADLPMFQEAAV